MRPLSRLFASGGSLGPVLARYVGDAAVGRHAARAAWSSVGSGNNNEHASRASFAASAAPPPPPPPQTKNMRVLVTGAAGQIGSDLVPFLARRLPPGAVLATDVRPPTTATTTPTIATATLDVAGDGGALARLAREHGATHIVHLAALLSARCEDDADLAIRVNSRGTEAALAAARAQNAALVLPSTIGVYGLAPEARSLPSSDDPRANPGRPTTLYGVTKAYAEGLGAWYAQRHGVDFRALRLPGVLSATAPGGGTTDYALHMLERAVEGVVGARGARGATTMTTTTMTTNPPYRCFVSQGVALPFMHASDTLAAFWRLLSAPRSRLSRLVYNVGAVTAAPEDWHAAFERAAREAVRGEAVGGGGGANNSTAPPPPPPLLSVEYAPDHRDAIARSWPAALDCSAAARDWGYAPQVGDVDAMARRLLAERLEAKAEAVAATAAAAARAAAMAAMAATGSSRLAVAVAA